ncbi:hypothetical protein [Alteromonas gilva]|uniref:Bacteriocin n=1 Tax=Alteromonas gilva TaxID=2987522 RepID=A0ABT5KXL4_9ALTE|nr:hypothetical protein [Alteromonas gilva]MDC8829505.1 hypothetical protein [Alteromonas gilva]
MQTLTLEQAEQVVGGDSSRENTQFIAGMIAGAFSGGNGFVMGAAGWLAGKYHDFQGHVSANGPTGAQSNHRTTEQYRQMQGG